MGRQVVEQIKCDNCTRVEERPLVQGEKGTRAEQGPLPNGWVAVTFRAPDPTLGHPGQKISQVFCGPSCAICALEATIAR